MVDFFTYLYYRIYQLYGGQPRKDALLALLVGLNILFIINVILRLAYFNALESYINFLFSLFAFDFAIIAFLSILVFPIVVYKKRKFFGKKMDEFKNESEDERKQNGRNIVKYIILSVMLLVITFIRL